MKRMGMVCAQCGNKWVLAWNGRETCDGEPCPRCDGSNTVETGPA